MSGFRLKSSAYINQVCDYTKIVPLSESSGLLLADTINVDMEEYFTDTVNPIKYPPAVYHVSISDGSISIGGKISMGGLPDEKQTLPTDPVPYKFPRANRIDESDGQWIGCAYHAGSVHVIYSGGIISSFGVTDITDCDITSITSTNYLLVYIDSGIINFKILDLGGGVVASHTITNNYAKLIYLDRILTDAVLVTIITINGIAGCLKITYNEGLTVSPSLSIGNTNTNFSTLSHLLPEAIGAVVLGSGGEENDPQFLSTIAILEPNVITKKLTLTGESRKSASSIASFFNTDILAYISEDANDNIVAIPVISTGGLSISLTPNVKFYLNSGKILSSSAKAIPNPSGDVKSSYVLVAHSLMIDDNKSYRKAEDVELNSKNNFSKILKFEITGEYTNTPSEVVFGTKNIPVNFDISNGINGTTIGGKTGLIATEFVDGEDEYFKLEITTSAKILASSVVLQGLWGASAGPFAYWKNSSVIKILTSPDGNTWDESTAYDAFTNTPDTKINIEHELWLDPEVQLDYDNMDLRYLKIIITKGKPDVVITSIMFKNLIMENPAATPGIYIHSLAVGDMKLKPEFYYGEKFDTVSLKTTLPYGTYHHDAILVRDDGDVFLAPNSIIQIKGKKYKTYEDIGNTCDTYKIDEA